MDLISFWALEIKFCLLDFELTIFWQKCENCQKGLLMSSRELKHVFLVFLRIYKLFRQVDKARISKMLL